MNKKGSEFVEASVVMPIVILAVLAVLWIIINLYSAASAQAAGHIYLRDYAGNDSGTQFSNTIISAAAPRDKFGQKGFASAQSAISGSLYVEGSGGTGILRNILKVGIYGKAYYDFDMKYPIGYNAATANHNASIYLINPSAGVRRVNIIKQSV